MLSGERQESGERVVRSERSPKWEGKSEGKSEGKRDDPHVDKRPVHRALSPKSEGVRVKLIS